MHVPANRLGPTSMRLKNNKGELSYLDVYIFVIFFFFCKWRPTLFNLACLDCMYKAHGH